MLEEVGQAADLGINLGSRNPTSRRKIEPKHRLTIPHTLMPWMRPAEGEGASRTLYMFPVAWWDPELIPPIYELGIWALADLDGDVQGLDFEGWTTPPNDVRDQGDAEARITLLGRLILPVEVYLKTPPAGTPSWRFTIPEELREAGCLPEHDPGRARHVLVFPLRGLLTIWRVGAWRACGATWRAFLPASEQ